MPRNRHGVWQLHELWVGESQDWRAFCFLPSHRSAIGTAGRSSSVSPRRGYELINPETTMPSAIALP